MDDRTLAVRDAVVRALAWADLAGTEPDVQRLAWAHHMTEEEIYGWLDDPDTWEAVDRVKEEMRAGGDEIRLKARQAVAGMIETAKEMFHDAESTPPAVRAQILRELARQGGVTGADDGSGQGDGGPRVQVLIDMRGPDGGGDGSVTLQSTGVRYPVVPAEGGE